MESLSRTTSIITPSFDSSRGGTACGENITSSPMMLILSAGRLVRTCAREGITGIDEAQQVLEQEVKRYNEHQLHSTTGEIPIIRFESALKEKQSLFRDFALPYPFQSVKDIFCFRLKRVVNSYRTISLNNLTLRVHNTPLHEEVELRITPDDLTSVYEIRIWYKDTLTDVYHVKSTDMKGVHF